MKDELGDRMKQYEYVTRTHLTKRTPVVIRVDGRAFHNFTKGFQRPFDRVFQRSMHLTMKYLCENIQGCVLGYQQSDEITLVLVDYKRINSCSWFDYNIQKCASIASSMASVAFNNFFTDNVYDIAYCELTNISDNNCHEEFGFKSEECERLFKTYVLAIDKMPMFDARCFNIPKEEVANCILWRQNDATRNSIAMVGSANFTQKELYKKSCNEIQDMLMVQKNINWNEFPTYLKRGCCCIKKMDSGYKRPKWYIDLDIPIFTGNGREYIENLVYQCES